MKILIHKNGLKKKKKFDFMFLDENLVDRKVGMMYVVDGGTVG